MTKKTRQLISRAAAIDASLAIIDKEGLDALSIRRLARELGVGTMTLYSYFQNKEELLDQIALQVVGNICEPQSPKGTWDVRLTQIMKRLHSIMLEHPGIGTLTISRRNPIAALDPFREVVLSILHDAGFPVRDAVNALTALATYVTGYSIVEHSRTDAQVDTERKRLAQLPKDQFPNLSASSRHYAAQISRQAFEFGLRSLIKGLALELEALEERKK